MPKRSNSIGIASNASNLSVPNSARTQKAAGCRTCGEPFGRAADRTPRLLPSLPCVLMVNLNGDESNVQPDYRRTVRPFLEKQLGIRIVPPMLERFFTSRGTLKLALGGLFLLYASFVMMPLGDSRAAVKFLMAPMFIAFSLLIVQAIRKMKK